MSVALSLPELWREPRWLLWRPEPAPDGGKPRKVPYYADCTPRRGALDTPEDIGHLVAFDDAQRAVRDHGGGFLPALAISAPLAFIDLDNCLAADGAWSGTDEQRSILTRSQQAGALVCRSWSGRGLHIYGRTDQRYTRRTPGVEVYTGARYAAWTGDIWSVGDAEEGLADLTGLLADICRPVAPQAPPGSEEPIPEGTRNNTLSSIGGALRRAGMSESDIAQALQHINTARCRPPLPEGEVARIAASMARYPPGSAEPARRPDAAVASAADSRAEPLWVGADEVGAVAVDPRTWFWDGLLAAGAHLVVGRPKVGKSWLLLQMALAAARGEDLLGYHCMSETGVLYVAAEDDVTRIKERLAAVGGRMPPGLRFLPGAEFRALAARHAGAGDGTSATPLIAWIAGVLARSPAIRMVIIDTEATCRAVWDGETGNSDPLGQDYRETREMDRVALEHRAAILLVNHSAKRRPGSLVDFHELINRTNVALAGASGSIVLADDPARDPEAEDTGRRVLALRARDLRDDITLAVERGQSDPTFRSLGHWSTVRSSDRERDILDALVALNSEAPGKWVTAREIARYCEASTGTIQRAITRMMSAGRNRHLDWRVEARPRMGVRLTPLYGAQKE